MAKANSAEKNAASIAIFGHFPCNKVVDAVQAGRGAAVGEHHRNCGKDQRTRGAQRAT